MNNPPFKIGQKVVCIETNPLAMQNSSFNENIHNGEVYIVTSCYWYSSTWNKFWAVTVSGLKTIWGCRSFAPIDDQKERIRYVAVSESLREKSVEIAAVETN